MHLLATYFLVTVYCAKGLAKLNLEQLFSGILINLQKLNNFVKKISERVTVEIALTSESISQSFLLESIPIHFPTSRWCARMYFITAAFKNKYKTTVPSLRKCRY